MLTAVNSANSFKAMYYTNDEFSPKQKKLCKDIETKLGDRINKHDYLIEPGPCDSVHFYTYNAREDRTGYFWSYHTEREPFDESHLKRLDKAHKIHLGLSLGLAGMLVLLLGTITSAMIKIPKLEKLESQLELANKNDTLKNNVLKDTLDLTKRFVK